MALSDAAPPALLVTADAGLQGAVARLAAAAAARLAVVAGPAEALAAWNGSAVVLVGPDQVDELARRSPPRHPHVHVVTGSPAPDTVFRAALGVGARSVLELPDGGPWLLEALAELSEGGARPGRSVAVLGASGGSGASVFAAALASVAGATSEVLLVDLDPLGPGQRVLLGHDDTRGITWADLAATAGRLGARALHDAVPRRQRLGVLGWPAGQPAPLLPELVVQAVAAGTRGHVWVVLDVPRHGGQDLHRVLAECDHVVLVARTGIGCLAAAARFLGGLGTDVSRAGLVVRSHRDGTAAPDVALALGLDLWAVMREERRLEEHLALGLGPVHASRGALARAASGVLARCARNAGRVAA